MFTRETGSSSSTACTSIWTFTILSGGTPAPGVWGQAAGLLSLPGKPQINRLTPSRLDGRVLWHNATLIQEALLYPCRLALCSILDILRREARVLEGLHNLGIKGEHQGKLLRLPVSAADDSYALDIRHPAIMVSHVRPLSFFVFFCFFARCERHSCSPFLCVLTLGCKLPDQSCGSCERVFSLPETSVIHGSIRRGKLSN